MTEENNWPEPTESEPDFETLSYWTMDGVCDATDGCRVEPDGTCPHGYPSWLMYLEIV